MRASARPHAFRASRHLVLHWDEDRLLGHNYLAKTTLPLPSDVLTLLAVLGTWRTEKEIAKLVPSLGEAASPILDVLAQASLIDKRVPDLVDHHDPLAMWGPWKPLAAALHFSTRNGIFPGDTDWEPPPAELGGAPMPEPCKHFESHARIALPPERQFGALTEALLARRTWRSFAPGALSLAELATLLRLTYGVRQWRPRAAGQLAFKTSPSGGARHPTEAYVAARSVEGVAPGLYHFDAARHDLVLLRPGVERTDLIRYAAGQECFGDAAIMVLMTTVFARTMWRYPSPRVYRTVHVELGHLGQTFCLLATALGLAPFSTMALSEAAIEGDLGLDGLNESAMYIVGAGRLP